MLGGEEMDLETIPATGGAAPKRSQAREVTVAFPASGQAAVARVSPEWWRSADVRELAIHCRVSG